MAKPEEPPSNPRLSPLAFVASRHVAVLGRRYSRRRVSRAEQRQAEAVDHLVQDVTIPDNILQSRAQQCLKVFANETNTIQVKRSLSWVERIQKAPSNDQHTFTTRDFFNLMCLVADELGLATGRRYVFAATCMCSEHVARVAITGRPDLSLEQRAAELAQALHELSSTWLTFFLGPCEFSTRYRSVHVSMTDLGFKSSLRLRKRIS